MILGDTRIHLVSDGTFGLDGGAMFGIVPKVLWSRLEPPDANNRITLGLNCLLVMRGDERILIDTGIGNKFDAKFAEIYAVRRENDLLANLAALGVATDDITHVIMSHMHFDHIGWNTMQDSSGELVPVFKNSVYYAQKGEYEVACDPDPRSKASYVAPNWVPLEKAGQLHLLHGTSEPLPGIEVMVTGGHTQHHSIVKVRTSERTVVFLADLVPTPSHLKTPYVMGYDLYPVQTMIMKEEVLHQAYAEEWLLVFEHSAHVKAGFLQKPDGAWSLEPVELN